MRGKERRWKLVALLAAGMAIGVTITATPAVGHVASWAHNWSQHIKPRTDARYYTKSQSNSRFGIGAKLRPGQTLTGVWATAGGADYQAANIAFRPRLPADIPAANFHFMADGATDANCPGAGQAALGHMCVYQWFNNGTSLVGWADPNSGDAFGAVKPNGVSLYLAGTATVSNSRGTWAVRAASGSSATARPAPRPSTSELGN